MNRALGGQVQGVEEFGQRHCGWARLPGELVGPGVGDHQGLGGRAHRVQQQLTVLGADVAFPGARFPGQRIVAVDHADPREHGVVQPGQAHHPVRHRAHRHHRADRQGPGPEVGPGGPARQLPAQQLLHVGEPQHRVGARSRTGDDVVELAFQLADLPGVIVGDLGEQRDALGQPGEPVAQRPGAGQRADHVLEPVDEFGQPARQLDPVAAHVVERKGGVDPGLRVVGERHPGQDAVQPEPPGVVDEAQSVGRSVLLVEAPPDVGLPHPGGDVVQVVVGEAEPRAHRFTLDEVENLRGGHPATGEAE